MGRLFTAGAESKDVSNTDGQLRLEGTMRIVTTGTIAADTSIVRSGVASFKCDSGASQGAAGIRYAFTGTLGRAYFARGYVYLPAAPPTNVSRTSIIAIQNGSSVGYVVGIASSGGVVYWAMSSSTGGTTVSTIPVITDRWFRLELKVSMGSGASDDVVEAMVDGVSIGSFSNGNQSTTAPAEVVFATPSYASNVVAYLDDLAVNDDQGSDQNTWPGEGRVALLLPTSDNSAGSWKAGSAGSASSNGALYDGINNTPPVGTASALAVTAGISNNVSGATNPNGDFNMNAYSDKVSGASAVINLVQQVIVHGEDISTGTKTGTFNIVSNPNTATTNVAQGGSNQFGPSAGGAVGTYLTNWAIQFGPVTYNPSVTLSTAPVARITKTDTGTRAADLCFMGILVDYTEVNPPQQVNVSFARQRAAAY